MPSARLRIFREKLIGSEFLEMTDAKNLEEIADAIGDLLYTIYGTAVAYGLDAQRIFDEIHRSNMTKLIDGKKDSHGKQLKGPSYSPPNLKPFLT